MLTRVVLAAAAGLGEPRALAAAGLAVEHHARALAPGEVVLIMVEVPADFDATALQLEFAGRTVAMTRVADGAAWRGLIGVDLDAAAAPAPVLVAARAADGRRLTERVMLELQPKTFRTRTLTVAPRYVTPPPGVQARIAREQRILRDALSHSEPQMLWDGAWQRPVPGISLSSFGVRSVFNGEPRAPHTGTDFRAPLGTPLRAPAGGVVVLAEEHYFTGRQVVIDHGLDTFSIFAHLSTFAVTPGERVERGSLLGATGATGRVTGPHLHWAVRVGGARVDAESLLEATAAL